MPTSRARELLSDFKTALEDALGYRIFVVPRSHIVGLSLTDDIRTHGDSIRTIFDVGAHKGETSLQFARSFPDADIFAFEPVAQNYNRIRKTLERENLTDRVRAVPLALGDRAGEAEINLSDFSSSHSIANSQNRHDSTKIKIDKLDYFCDRNNIGSIDILKVDTEGHDVKVLKGSENNLSDGRVQYVVCEVTLSDENEFFCTFENVRTYLKDQGFRFLALYDQSLDWKEKRRHAFANALFFYDRRE
mgnify:CR=1 FL=1